MLDTEESFPKTPYESINTCRSVIKEHKSTKAPSKKIEFRDIMVCLFGSKRPVLVHFGFVYSRTLKQYFLFVESNSNDYFNRLFAVMNHFLITENRLIFLSQFNIILSAHVYYPPRDPNASPTSASSTWYSFKHGLDDFGGFFDKGRTDEGLTVDGLTNSMDSFWEQFMRVNGIKTSD